MPESFGNHSCFFDYPFNTFCAISMYSSRTTAGEIIRIFPAKRKIQEKKFGLTDTSIVARKCFSSVTRVCTSSPKWSMTYFITSFSHSRVTI